MRGSYSSYTQWNTEVVGLILPAVPEPGAVSLYLGMLGVATLRRHSRRRRAPA